MCVFFLLVCFCTYVHVCTHQSECLLLTFKIQKKLYINVNAYFECNISTNFALNYSTTFKNNVPTATLRQ